METSPVSWRSKRFTALALILLISTFALYPLFHPGLPSTADGLVHLYRAVELNEAWQDGVYFPRWAEHLGLGYGIPLFNFVPPLPYYIVVIFHHLGLGFEDALKALIAGGFLAYGIGMYLLVSASWGQKAGLLAAALHMYSPYHLREAFIQGDYPQFLSLVFIPLAFWAFRRLIIEGRRVDVILAALALTGVLLSHNVTALLFTPVILTYIALFLYLHPGTNRLGMVALGVGLGLGLTASFWLPALWETISIQTSRMMASDYHARFVPWRELLSLPVRLDVSCENSLFPFSLGTAPLILSIIALGGLLVKGRRSWKKHLEAFFFLIMVTFFAFMATDGSTWLWEHLPFLNFLQWPWRMHGLALVGLAYLGGAAYGIWWGDPKGKIPTLTLMGVLLASLTLSFPYLYPHHNPPIKSQLGPEEIIAFERATGAVGTTSYGEFHPIWVEEFPGRTAMESGYFAGGSFLKLDGSTIPSGAVATLLEERVGLQQYRLYTPEATRLRFHTFYFPGWRAYLDGKSVPIHIAKPQGTMEVEVPVGEHQLALSFEDTPLRRISEIVSALSLAITLAWLGVNLARPLPRPKAGISRGQDGLSSSEAQILALGLASAFIVKTALIDSHTSWFLRRSPLDSVPNLQHPMQIDFGGEVRFLGYDIDRDFVLQGGEVKLVLYWRALKDLERNYVPFLHLQAPPYYDEVYTQAGNWHPANINTTRWSPSRYIRDPEKLTIPPDIPPLLYSLRLGMYDVKTGERLRLEDENTTLELMPLRVIRARPLREKDLPHRIGTTRLVNGVELVGYDLKWEEGNSRRSLAVTLYWRARAKILADYTVFVHLLDGGGNIVAQDDSMPMEGRYATSSWQTGELIEDIHHLNLPQQPSGGGYRLAVGMYILETMSRVEVEKVGKGASLSESRILLDQLLGSGR